MVLGRGAHERGATNVDLLDHVGWGCAGSDGLDERVQVGDDEFEGRDAEVGELALVRFEPEVGEEARVDCGMQGANPSVEGLGEPGDGGDVGDGEPGIPNRLSGGAGRHDLDTGVDEGTGEIGQPGLVAHRDECPRDRDCVAVAVVGGVVARAAHESSLRWMALLAMSRTAWMSRRRSTGLMRS